MKQIFVTIISLTALSCYASSVQIISGSSNAKACAKSASFAAVSQTASKNKIEQCSEALSNESLIRKDRAATLVNRAVLYMQISEFKLAHQDLLKAQSIKPDLGAIYVNLGNIYLLAEKYETALEKYNLAIQYELPELHVAFMNRGITFKLMQEYNLAIKDFEQAQKLAPQWELPQRKISETRDLKESHNANFYEADELIIE